MKGKIIEEISNKIGTPFFLYRFEKIKSQYNKLENMLPKTAKIYYSIKANPSIGICQAVRGLTKYAEVSSIGELICALKSGFEKDKILFSGPGKQLEELKYAILHNITINVESKSEILLIKKICVDINSKANIYIRINPDFKHTNASVIMSGISSQFGIDVSNLGDVILTVNKTPRVNLKGLSVYLGSQILDVETVYNILNLFDMLRKQYQLNIKEFNFGGGFGVSYYDSKKLNHALLKTKLHDLFMSHKTEIQGIDIFFESGRFLMADAGDFYTKVLYKKTSKGKEYLICDGGFNNIIISFYRY